MKKLLTLLFTALLALALAACGNAKEDNLVKERMKEKKKQKISSWCIKCTTC